MPGYRATDPVPARLICRYCRLLVRNAVQLMDGTLVCESCCADQMRSTAADQVHRDHAVRKEVQRIQVHCDNAVCMWTGKAADLEMHCVLCPNAPQPCPHQGCMEMLPESKLDNHVQYCPFRRVTCLWCDYETALNLMDHHFRSTHPRTSSHAETNVQLGALRYNLGMCGPPVSAQPSPFILAPAPVSIMQHRAPIQEQRNMLPSVCVPGHDFSYLKIQNPERRNDLVREIQVIITSTHNCIFIWGIPNIARRRHEAAEERVTSIYSPPFYTSHNGYKICIRVYLNGDGYGHTTHLSVFFVLMKGEYDHILNWPFNHKVSLVLVNQNQRKDIVRTFSPTPESNSFERPTTNMNIASGCPRFARLSVLDDTDYVEDDVLYIKCIVDTSKIFHP